MVLNRPFIDVYICIYIYIYINIRFPFQIITGTGIYNKGFRLLRLPRLYKLLKVLRLFKMLKESELYQKIIFMIKLNTGMHNYIYTYILIFF